MQRICTGMSLINCSVASYQGEIKLLIFHELTLVKPNETCNKVSSRNETVDWA